MCRRFNCVSTLTDTTLNWKDALRATGLTVFSLCTGGSAPLWPHWEVKGQRSSGPGWFCVSAGSSGLGCGSPPRTDRADWSGAWGKQTKNQDKPFELGIITWSWTDLKKDECISTTFSNLTWFIFCFLIVLFLQDYSIKQRWFYVLRLASRHCFILKTKIFHLNFEWKNRTVNTPGNKNMKMGWYNLHISHTRNRDCQH